MNPISRIRARLGVTQSAMAEGLGVSQGNISNYERGQSMPPDVAKRLIAYAASLDQPLTFNDVYGDPQPQEETLPERAPTNQASPVPLVTLETSEDRPRRQLSYGKNVLSISIDQRPIDDVKN